MVALGCLLISSTTLASIFSSINLQSQKKPACTSQPLQPGQLTFSKLKFSSQFCMLDDPLKETMILFLALQYPTQQEETVNRLLMQVTQPKFTNSFPLWQFQDSRHFLGQYANTAQQTYYLDSVVLQSSLGAFGPLQASRKFEETYITARRIISLKGFFIIKLQQSKVSSNFVIYLAYFFTVSSGPAKTFSIAYFQ